MVEQRQPIAWSTFRNLDGDRRTLGLQSAASAIAGRIPRGVRNVDDEKLDPVFWDFFQVNKLTGEPRGIVGIRLRGGRKR